MKPETVLAAAVGTLAAALIHLTHSLWWLL